MRTDRPFQPVRRVLTIAITVSAVFAIVGWGKGLTVTEALFAFFATFALALGVGCLLYRQDLAALVRAHRED